MPLRGIRGATVVNENTPSDIVSGTSELLEKLMVENQVDKADIASIFFSVTPDLDAEFPAVAARKLGLLDTPLLCLNEIPVPESLGRCIRILMHVNADQPQSEMVHIYLKEAVSLRPDRG